MFLKPYVGVEGARWLLRTSNPLCLVTSGVGGFDSLALPPQFFMIFLGPAYSGDMGGWRMKSIAAAPLTMATPRHMYPTPPNPTPASSAPAMAAPAAPPD